MTRWLVFLLLAGGVWAQGPADLEAVVTTDVGTFRFEFAADRVAGLVRRNGRRIRTCRQQLAQRRIKLHPDIIRVGMELVAFVALGIFVRRRGRL